METGRRSALGRGTLVGSDRRIHGKAAYPGGKVREVELEASESAAARRVRLLRQRRRLVAIVRQW